MTAGSTNCGGGQAGSRGAVLWGSGLRSEGDAPGQAADVLHPHLRNAWNSASGGLETSRSPTTSLVSQACQQAARPFSLVSVVGWRSAIKNWVSGRDWLDCLDCSLVTLAALPSAAIVHEQTRAPLEASSAARFTPAAATGLQSRPANKYQTKIRFRAIAPLPLSYLEPIWPGPIASLFIAAAISCTRTKSGSRIPQSGPQCGSCRSKSLT